MPESHKPPSLVVLWPKLCQVQITRSPAVMLVVVGEKRLAPLGPTVTRASSARLENEVKTRPAANNEITGLERFICCFGNAGRGHNRVGPIPDHPRIDRQPLRCAGAWRAINGAPGNDPDHTRPARGPRAVRGGVAVPGARRPVPGN